MSYAKNVTKWFSTGHLYDQSGTEILDADGNHINAYIYLQEAVINRTSVQQEIQGKVTFEIQFLTDNGGHFLPASTYCTTDVPDDKKDLFANYMAGFASSDDQDAFDEFLLGCQEAINVL